MTALTDNPPEDREELISIGDGWCYVHTTYLGARPIVVGSVRVYMVPAGVLDQIVPIEERRPISAGVTVCEESGRVLVSLDEPLPVGSKLVARYKWQPPLLRNARFPVMIDGSIEWVPASELRKLIHSIGW